METCSLSFPPEHGKARTSARGQRGVELWRVSVTGRTDIAGLDLCGLQGAEVRAVCNWQCRLWSEACVPRWASSP